MFVDRFRSMEIMTDADAPESEPDAEAGVRSGSAALAVM
jgi:hypothetical protein